jgi:transglutaminase-like putative cysteine protease
MKKFVSLLLAVLGILLLQAAPDIKNLIAHAGETKDYPGKSEIILFDSTMVDVNATGLSYVTIHKLVKILTQAGANQNAVIKFGYDPLSAYVDIKAVKIFRKSGEEITLDMSNVLDYPAPARAIYWGAREKMIEVGRLEPGDAIEVFLFRKGFTYALLQQDNEDDKYIPPMRGHYYDIVEFWSSNPVLEKVYQLALPKDKVLQYEFYHGDIGTSVKPKGGNMVYTFTKKNYTEPTHEPNMVAYSDEFPKLLLSTSPDWNAKSVWFYGVNEDFGSFESTPEIDQKVAEVLVGAKDEMDSVSLLTHWVADNIRYSGISMGCGEGFTLHKGEMTFSDRCGVCKDKAGMLITMLRAAGFESYAAMTMAGSRIDYISADQFNHSVTIVKLSDGKYHILDPTWVPFVRELWSSLEQQQNYLMGVPEGADLMITPVSDPRNHFIKIEGTSKIALDGTLTGEFVLDAEGQSDAAIRRMFTGANVSTWDANLEKELISVFPRAEIISMSYGKPYNYLNEALQIKIKYKIPEFALVTMDEIIFTPVVASNIFKRAMSHLSIDTSPESRSYQFRDRCSRWVQLGETITLPENFSVIYAPQTSMISGTGASFKGGYDFGEKMVTVSENIKFNKRVYDPEDWVSFREVVKTQTKMAEEPLILKIEKVIN